MEDIPFHDTLNGFWAGRGTRITTLEAKMLQQLTAIREAVLFEVFLDLRKAYDTFDQERTLDLLTTYKAGPMTVRLLRTYWDRLMTRSTGFRRDGGQGPPPSSPRCSNSLRP